MTTDSNISRKKREVILFLALGLAFTAIGFTNAEFRLFILAGVGFLLNAAVI
ncbi:MAG: hypothetical protein GKR91_15230 [Pseudomonadales bacterium]|nr:hypothetical protein [Pseudomonadales bacterium]